MPEGAKILAVEAQYEKPCMWALVDPNQETETRHFEVFGTGHPIHYDSRNIRKYIGTYQLNNGGLIFHVFERN